MDVGHKFQKTGVFLTKDEYISVLKKMAMPARVAVVADGMAGQQPAHHRGHLNGAGSQKQVKMIGNQCPSIADRLGLLYDLSQAFNKSYRSWSSRKILQRSIPRTMIWCRAPVASMRDCLGMYHAVTGRPHGPPGSL